VEKKSQRWGLIIVLGFSSLMFLGISLFPLIGEILTQQKNTETRTVSIATPSPGPDSIAMLREEEKIYLKVLEDDPNNSVAIKGLAETRRRMKQGARQKNVKRPTDDSGVALPTKTGYVKGYPALATGGRSSVTVDNSQNSSDVLVKLFTLDNNPPKAVSVFFIRAHDKFTVEDIKAGQYDVRYRDLSSKGLSRTEQFNLKEVRTSTGVKFSRLTLTLYKVVDGNMQTQPISEDEF
jgi:hypothetical protein